MKSTATVSMRPIPQPRMLQNQLWQTIPEGFHRMGTQADRSSEEHCVPSTVPGPPGQRTRIRFHLCDCWGEHSGDPEQGQAERKEHRRLQHLCLFDGLPSPNDIRRATSRSGRKIRGESRPKSSGSIDGHDLAYKCPHVDPTRASIDY